MKMVSSVSNNPSHTEPRPSNEAKLYAEHSPPDHRVSVSVQHEAGESAVLVVVAPVRLPPVQFDVNLVSWLQVEDDAVAGVVVVLVCILSDGAGSDLEKQRGQR